MKGDFTTIEAQQCYNQKLIFVIFITFLLPAVLHQEEEDDEEENKENTNSDSEEEDNGEPSSKRQKTSNVNPINYKEKKC